MAAPACADFFGIILGAVLLLFCCSIIYAVRRWLKTQAAAEMGAANEVIYLRRRRTPLFLKPMLAVRFCLFDFNIY
jgi:hypothetical protein